MVDNGMVATHLDPALSGDGPPESVVALVGRGGVAFAEYRRSGRLDALESAVAAFRGAVDATGKDDGERAFRLSLLRISLQARFTELGDPADRAEVVEVARRAVAAASSDDPGRTGMLLALSKALLTEADFDGAVEAASQAVDGAGLDHRYRSEYLYTLAEARWRRFCHREDRADLDAAADGFRSAAKVAVPGSPDELRPLSMLANVLRTRFVHAGKRVDIDDAVEAARSAVDGTEPGGPVYAGRLFNLALALGTRFDGYGDLADLDDAIDAGVRSVNETWQSGPELSERIAALDYLRSLRADVPGDPVDLDRIVESVATGALPLDDACELAQRHAAAGVYPRNLLVSKADVAFRLVGADPAGAWRLGRIVASAARGAYLADRGRAAAIVLLQADANLIDQAHAVLLSGGDIRVFAAAMEAAREALQIAAELDLAQARGAVLQRRGALVLACYARGPDGLHAQAFQDWVAAAFSSDPDPQHVLAVAQTTGRDLLPHAPSLRWPDPVDALTDAVSDLRTALALVAPQRRGPVLKALGDALDWRQRLGGPAASPELAEVCREALTVLPESDVAGKLAVEAMLGRAVGAPSPSPSMLALVDQLDTAWQDVAVRPWQAWDAAGMAAAALADADPSRALRLLQRRRELAVVWADEARRTEHHMRSLELLALASVGPTLRHVLDSVEELRSRREGILAGRVGAGQLAGALTALVVAAVRFDEDATGLLAMSRLREHAPELVSAHVDAFGFVEGQLLLGEGFAKERAGDHQAAAQRFLAAADTAAAVPLAGEVLRALTCATTLIQKGRVPDLTPVVAWCATAALSIDLAAPKAGPAAWQRLTRLLLAAMVRAGTSAGEVLTLMQTAKGCRMAAQLAIGSAGWTPRPQLRRLLAEEVSRAQSLPSADPTVDIDAELTLVAYVSDYETSPSDTAPGALANLRRAAERQIMADITPRQQAGPPPSLDAILAALERHTALLVLYAGELDSAETMFGLLISHTGCHLTVTSSQPPHITEPIIAIGHSGRHRIHVPALGLQVNAVRRAVQEEPAPRPLSRAGDEELARLHDWALQAVRHAADQLRDSGISRLIINPHGPLHFAPLHLAGAHGRPLADDFLVTYVANLAQLFSQPAASPRRQGAAVFALSYAGHPWLPYLSSSAAEGHAIAGRLGIEPTLDSHATPAAVLTALQQQRWVHLRAHGQHDADAPMFQTVYLASSDDDDGRLLTHQVVPLDLRGLELVTLGACETSLGRIDLADNLRGLSAALLTAGAHAVIGTLWQVSAAASTTFFTVLYDALHHDGATVSTAYQTAQQATRRQHPEYRDWGAFYLTGGHDMRKDRR